MVVNAPVPFMVMPVAAVAEKLRRVVAAATKVVFAAVVIDPFGAFSAKFSTLPEVDIARNAAVVLNTILPVPPVPALNVTVDVVAPLRVSVTPELTVIFRNALSVRLVAADQVRIGLAMVMSPLPPLPVVVSTITLDEASWV